MSVMARIEVEMRMACVLVQSALDAGYYVTVDNGEEELKPKQTTRDVLLEMFTTDMDRLHLYQGGRRLGWVLFVYGNEGWDVISDYTDKPEIEKLVEKTKALSDHYDDPRKRHHGPEILVDYIMTIPQPPVWPTETPA